MERHIIYTRDSVQPLSSLASAVFGKSLIKCLVSVYRKENEMETVEQIRQHLMAVGTTTPAYQDLLETILNNKPLVYALAVEILFNKHFKRFRTTNSTRTALTISSKCDSLEFLNLQQLYWDETQWYVSQEILRNCGNLKEIKLPNSANNDIWLPLLSTYCPKLRSLSTPSIIGLSSLVSASFRTTLTSIILTEYDFDKDEYFLEVSTLLVGCPNLKLICPDVNLIGILQYCRNENENFTCNLESLEIEGSNEALLNMMQSTCPKLIDLSLYSPLDGSYKFLSNIALQFLDISDFEYQDLLQFIKNIGENLRTLRLRSINKTSTVNITELLKYCPKLSALKLYSIDARYPRSIGSSMELKKFHMTGCRYSKLEFIDFLSNLRFLEEFYADEVPFTDEDIERFFGQRTFLNFKKFFVIKATNLTIRSVHTLLHSCPNLNSIGELLKWNINEADINLIPCLKATNNSVFWKMYIQLYNY